MIEYDFQTFVDSLKPKYGYRDDILLIRIDLYYRLMEEIK